MPPTGVWKSRFRFLLFVYPRVLAGQFSATRMAGYAIEFTKDGSQRIASRCLKLAVEKSIDNPHAFDTGLNMFLDASESSLASEYASAVFGQNGIMPGVAAQLTGEFLYNGACTECLQNLDRLIELSNGNLENTVPAPAYSHKTDVLAIREQLFRHCGEEKPGAQEASDLNRAVARLCFRYSAFDTAAKLFGNGDAEELVDIEDQIAYACSLLRSGRPVESKAVSERFDLGLKVIDADVEWQMLNATTMFAIGSTSKAKAAIRACLRSRLSTLPDLEDIVRYCDQIVDSLASFPNRLIFEPNRNADHQPGIEGTGPQTSKSVNARPKLFICGNGWSGSGAVYDALTDFDSVAVAPDIPIDQFMNKDTNNELMFVQGESGLGRLWRKARDDRSIGRMDLWELFRCHVIGFGAIGFSEHKSANAAASLLERHGGRIVREFRNAFREFTRLPEKACLSQLHGQLVTATEALTELIFDPGHGQCVVFNNAMFGANLDMVEIFANFKLVVVVRDPLDQYADRREHDLKHWMSARRFVSFYKSGRAAFHTCQEKLPGELPSRVREVTFEKFVQDSRYREGVLNWLLDGLRQKQKSSEFDPATSSDNVGIHKTLLTKDEIALLDNELTVWRSH